MHDHRQLPARTDKQEMGNEGGRAQLVLSISQLQNECQQACCELDAVCSRGILGTHPLHLFRLCLVDEELDEPRECSEDSGPGVRRAYCCQIALANLEGVLEAFEELRHLLLQLTKALEEIGVELAHEEAHDIHKILCSRAGEDL